MQRREGGGQGHRTNTSRESGINVFSSISILLALFLILVFVGDSMLFDKILE